VAKLEITRAPPTWLPRRFLLAAAAWGVVAGGLLLLDGASLLHSRWAPGTLALVHALTLGLMGNAMCGSLLQFLPAAAGVGVRGGSRVGVVLLVLLNGGALLLVAGFRAMAPAWLMVAGSLLAIAFALLATMVLPGLWRRLRAGGARLLHAGLAGAVFAALATAALGMAMVAGLAGGGGLALLPWADVHAAWGVLGWVLGLLASVGAVVVPMFQGTPAPADRARLGWQVALAVVLLPGTLCVALEQRAALLQWGGATLLVVFAGTGLWLQVRARHTRNGWLLRSWRIGLAALLAAAIVLVAGGPAVLLGTLALAVGLPWLVAGMQLEIGAFLGWIELQRRCERGVRVPHVHLLLEDRDKAIAFALMGTATLALLLAACWPGEVVARGAGLAFAIAQGWLAACLLGIGRRVRGFLASTPVPRRVGHAD
jgi:hypothetical protein